MELFNQNPELISILNWGREWKRLKKFWLDLVIPLENHSTFQVQCETKQKIPHRKRLVWLPHIICDFEPQASSYLSSNDYNIFDSVCCILLPTGFTYEIYDFIIFAQNSDAYLPNGRTIEMISIRKEEESLLSKSSLSVCIFSVFIC